MEADGKRDGQPHLIPSPLPPSIRQDEEHHELTSDVRSQLRFFEQLERMEKQRKDEQEREILLKAAKVRKRCCIMFRVKRKVKVYESKH